MSLTSSNLASSNPASSNTEIVAALGLGERPVRLDSNSDWPPELVARLPRVGPGLAKEAGPARGRPR